MVLPKNPKLPILGAEKAIKEWCWVKTQWAKLSVFGGYF